ncbi:MAG TPA: hypothetical protein VF763_06420 [Candidatus Limnocylindrales bacterium]
MKARNVLALAAGSITLGGWGWWAVGRPWWHGWGVEADEAGRPLPGDDVVADATVSDTRGITIDAPPPAVWPWLVQMGYGRGGWYSYDAVDMRGGSARRIVPEWQSLAVGDVVPTHPGGGFEVRILEPEHALVLYSDSALVSAQERAAAADPGSVDPTPVNVQAAGTFLANAQPGEFSASWAFVIEPLPDGRSRLLERFRARFGAAEQPWTRVTMPVLGFGVFAMMRRQLLGIRERAETAARSGAA